MHEALVGQGVKSRLLEAKRNDPGAFLKLLFEDPPECTLSFNGLLPDDKGNFFCELIKIPHVACLVDSPNSFLPLMQSPRTIMTCVDRCSVDFFHGLGSKKVFFLPHGVEKSLFSEHDSKKEYDVVFLASCIDFETIREAWKKKFSSALCQVMDEASEIALSDQNIPYYQAFVQALDQRVNEKGGIDPGKVDFISVLHNIEMYIRGKDRVELIRSINEAQVDVFGSSDEKAGWKKYVGNKRNVKIHDPIPFEQAIEIMKRTKILLNSCTWIKYGAHERILSGLASGALVITDENPYLREHFTDGESIVFYQHHRLDKANHRINEYLANSKKREQLVRKGREIVLKSHTWDHRAAQLLKALPQFLKVL